MSKGSLSCFTGRVNVDLVGVQVLLVWQSCRKCQTCVRTVLCSMTWALASLCAIKSGPSLRWFCTTKCTIILASIVDWQMKKYGFTELIKR